MKKQSEVYSFSKRNKLGRVLDFSNMTAEETKRLNEIALNLQKPYTEFVDGCCRKYGNVPLFWATPLASRNIDNDSDTFLSLCRIFLAIELAAKDEIKVIITLFKSEKRVLSSCINKSVRIETQESSSIFTIIKFCLVNLRAFLLFCKNEIDYSKYTGRSRPKFNSPISIVITPTLSSCFRDYVYQDRYFTGITEYGNVVFLPYIVNNTGISSKKLIDNYKHCSNYSFLLPFHYFRIYDLLDIVKYRNISGRIAHNNFSFNGIDVSALIRRCLIKGKNNNTSYKGVLIRKILFRLSKDYNGSSVRNFLVWYEGRPCDLMTVSAIRDFFPNSRCVGYEGYPIPENDLSLCISEYQYESEKSPNAMAIPGIAYESLGHRFCKKIPLIYTPILRNEYRIRKHKTNHGNPLTILVILPIFKDIARDLIMNIGACINNMQIQCVILLKNHPVNTGLSLEEYGIENVDFPFEFVDGNLNDILMTTDIAVASLSSSTLEVLFSGVPLVISCPKGKLGYSSLPENKFREMYKIVYGEEELEMILEKWVNRYPIIDNSSLDDLLVKKSYETVSQLI